MLGMTDPLEALDLDLALAEFGQREAWRHMRETNGGDPDWFVSMLLLVMDMV